MRTIQEDTETRLRAILPLPLIRSLCSSSLGTGVGGVGGVGGAGVGGVGP